MGIAKMPKGGTKLIARMLRYVAQNYKWSLLLAIVCIFVTSVTTLTSTLFTKTLIDDHILPLTQAASPDFEPRCRRGCCRRGCCRRGRCRLCRHPPVWFHPPRSPPGRSCRPRMQ